MNDCHIRCYRHVAALSKAIHWQDRDEYVSHALRSGCITWEQVAFRSSLYRDFNWGSVEVKGNGVALPDAVGSMFPCQACSV